MQWRQATAAVIEAAIPQDPVQRGTWPDFAALLPHAQAALTADSYGLQRIADYLGSSGSYVAARELYPGILTNRLRALGAEHPDVLADRASLAHWTGQAGDEAGARDQNATLLPVRERVLGAEHPDVLAVRASLAHWTGRAGDAAGARDQNAALLPVIERVLGAAEHPNVLAARARARPLDRSGGRCGRGPRPVRGAAPGALSGCPARSTRMPWPPEHELAHWTGQAGDAAGARDQNAALLPGDRAGPRRGAPECPGRPRQPRPPDRSGRRCGRGPRPERGATTR